MSEAQINKKLLEIENTLDEVLKVLEVNSRTNVDVVSTIAYQIVEGISDNLEILSLVDLLGIENSHFDYNTRDARKRLKDKLQKRKARLLEATDFLVLSA